MINCFFRSYSLHPCCWNKFRESGLSRVEELKQVVKKLFLDGDEIYKNGGFAYVKKNFLRILLLVLVNFGNL